jgi:hypothetical protein
MVMVWKVGSVYKGPSMSKMNAISQVVGMKKNMTNPSSHKIQNNDNQCGCRILDWNMLLGITSCWVVKTETSAWPERGGLVHFEMTCEWDKRSVAATQHRRGAEVFLLQNVVFWAAMVNAPLSWKLMTTVKAPRWLAVLTEYGVSHAKPRVTSSSTPFSQDQSL